ncbi:MAG TPA: hypothetical protein VFD71_14925, partial [Planctomycetota bacterium]|nr:hypothetical protein [Planctomycetota bacterium]
SPNGSNGQKETPSGASASLDPESGEPLVEIVPQAPVTAGPTEEVVPSEAPAALEAKPRRSRARKAAPPEGETAAITLGPDASS